MQRPSSTALVALLASATFFGGAVLAQAGGEDNRDVPAGDGGAAASEVSGGVAHARALDPEVLTYTVPSAAFTADGADPDSFFFPFGGGYFRGTSANYGCMVAPVDLPNGSQINSLISRVWDDDATFGASVVLRRVNHKAGGTTTMATASTSGPDQAASVVEVTDDTVTDNVVDTDNFAYFVTVCLLSDDIRLYSVQLLYQAEADPHSPVVVPVTPFRAYDSRFVDGPLGEGDNRLVSVRRSIDIETGATIDNNAIPAGATAIFFNVAVTNTIGGGFLAATPGGAGTFSSASINWSATGQTFNNGTFVELDGNRRIRAFVGGTPGAETDFVIDITGYVLPGG